MQDEYVKVTEAAKRLHVRIETVRRYIRQGYIVAATLPGGDYRIAESELGRIVQPVAKVEANGNDNAQPKVKFAASDSPNVTKGRT
jgi:excisionase family DNA binding protein